MKNSGKISHRIRVIEVGKSTGGIGTYLRWLAAGLDKAAFEITFACLSDGGPELAEAINVSHNAKAISWPMNRFKINLFSDFLLILRLARFIRSKAFDLIHAHGSKAGFIVRLAVIGTRVPIIYSPHGFAFQTPGYSWKKRLYVFIESLAARFLTARIITVSNNERLDALKRGVGVPDLYVTIHSGIDPSLFKRFLDKRVQKTALGVPADGFLIGTVGTFTEAKAPYDFIRLASLLHQKHSEMHFIWAGTGALEAQARALSDKLGLEGFFHFAGHRSDVPAILSALDCFVLTSHWEAFPLAVLEAMAAALPVVATQLGGIEEMIESGRDGYLIPVGDLNNMANIIGEISADPRRAAEMGSKARHRVENDFTHEAMLKKIMVVYQSVFEKSL